MWRHIVLLFTIELHGGTYILKYNIDLGVVFTIYQPKSPFKYQLKPQTNQSKQYTRHNELKFHNTTLFYPMPISQMSTRIEPHHSSSFHSSSFSYPWLWWTLSFHS